MVRNENGEKRRNGKSPTRAHDNRHKNAANQNFDQIAIGSFNVCVWEFMCVLLIMHSNRNENGKKTSKREFAQQLWTHYRNVRCECKTHFGKFLCNSIQWNAQNNSPTLLRVCTPIFQKIINAFYPEKAHMRANFLTQFTTHRVTSEFSWSQNHVSTRTHRKNDKLKNIHTEWVNCCEWNKFLVCNLNGYTNRFPLRYLFYHPFQQSKGYWNCFRTGNMY